MLFQSGAGGPPDAQTMVAEFSGRVSGLLDDLGEAMAMLHDLLPAIPSFPSEASIPHIRQNWLPGLCCQNS